MLWQALYERFKGRANTAKALYERFAEWAMHCLVSIYVREFHGADCRASNAQWHTALKKRFTKPVLTVKASINMDVTGVKFGNGLVLHAVSGGGLWQAAHRLLSMRSSKNASKYKVTRLYCN